MTKINHSLNLSQKNLRLNLLGSASLALALSLPIAALAAPQGGVVVGGTANISTSGATTNINQSSNRAAINWDSFDVASSETVNFTVPNRGATLNRVIGGAPSLIQGTVKSNGTLYLVNQNGLVFDTGSKVYAQNFIATTSNIDPDKFMAGGPIQLEQSAINAKISLNGEIKVADRGIVGLFAPQVANSGTITANLGQVVLAGAQTAVIDFTGDGLMNFELGESESRGGEGISVENNGLISASGGKVVLTAQGAKDMMNAVVTANGGVINVSSPVRDGSVSLIATNGNLDIDDGAITIKANGSTGGNITLVADGNHDMYFGFMPSFHPLLVASQDITIKIGGDLSLYGGVIAVRDLILSSRSLYFGKRITAGRDIIANSQDLISQAYVTAGRDITIGTSDYLILQGNFTAGRNINLGSNGDLTSQGNLAAGRNINLGSNGDLTSGNLAAGQDINLGSNGNLVSQGNLAAGRNINLVSNGDLTFQGNLAARQDINLGSNGNLVSQGNLAGPNGFLAVLFNSANLLSSAGIDAG